MCRWGVQDFRGCVQDLARPSLPPPDRPKFRSCFSLSRHNFLSFFSLFGVLPLNFGGVFEGRDPQNFTKGPHRERRKKENCGGRGKKKREILGLPPFWAPPFWAPPFWFGPHPERPPPFGTSQFGPHPPPTRWPKAALAKTGQYLHWPKQVRPKQVKLA